MKVIELIELLSKCDPDAEVVVTSSAKPISDVVIFTTTKKVCLTEKN